jgi:hypothetical protein
MYVNVSAPKQVHFLCRASSSSSSSSSSSTIRVAGGNPAYRTSAFEAVCTLTPILVSPFISRGAPRHTAWETSIRERRNYGREMADFHIIAGFFNMPQSCDMGQTALLPLRRKACWGFFRPKNPMASAGFEPANLCTRGQHASHYTTEATLRRSYYPSYQSIKHNRL